MAPDSFAGHASQGDPFLQSETQELEPLEGSITLHQIFRFVAFAGDSLSVGVDVTEILPGTGFTDDDTKLFLFDSSGLLLAENDDALDPFESLSEDFLIHLNGTYFIGVTTFDNNPILDANGIGTVWEDDGESNVEFDLFVSRVSAVPEPSTLTLLGTGVISLLVYT